MSRHVAITIGVINMLTLSQQRLNYDLDLNSVVFDIGGFKGDFASDLLMRYGCQIHVFEPVSSFYNLLRNRFVTTPSVHLHPFGLSDKSEKVKIGVDWDSSSVYKPGVRPEVVQLREIGEVIDELSIGDIDLVKINIEGGEFPLLEHSLKNQLVSKMKNIQVQFHKEWGPENAISRRENIHNHLQKSHELTYNYDWIWENWKLKD